jgi:hypothetical protein
VAKSKLSSCDARAGDPHEPARQVSASQFTADDHARHVSHSLQRDAKACDPRSSAAQAADPRSEDVESENGAEELHADVLERALHRHESTADARPEAARGHELSE